MSDSRVLFTEESIITSIQKLLSGRVNEILGEAEFSIPPVEFGSAVGGDYAVTPAIRLSACERTEKERIIRLDAYSLTLNFTLPETPESELLCYAYAAAVDKAVSENPALGGLADRVEITGKKYVPPKKTHCGEGWEIVLSLRITVQVTGNR